MPRRTNSCYLSASLPFSPLPPLQAQMPPAKPNPLNLGQKRPGRSGLLSDRGIQLRASGGKDIAHCDGFVPDGGESAAADG